MIRLALSVFASVMLSVCLVPVSQAVEILRWERLPLAVPLIVGQERVVFIDRNVRVGVPANLRDHLRVQSAAGAIYLRASDPIAPTRLQLQDVESGSLLLLDIVAEPPKDGQQPLEPLRVVEAAVSAKRYGITSSQGSDEPKDTEKPPAMPRETPIPVVLTRYAAQNLYAPLRTVESAPGIARANLRRDLPLETLLPTLPVRVRALAAWRLEDQWVTAVRLTNTSERWIDLDPRALQGDFTAATFQHPNLGPSDQSTDTTVLYLVTRNHGLSESLLPAISTIDAGLNLPPAAAVGSIEGTHDEK